MRVRCPVRFPMRFPVRFPVRFNVSSAAAVLALVLALAGCGDDGGFGPVILDLGGSADDLGRDAASDGPDLVGTPALGQSCPGGISDCSGGLGCYAVATDPALPPQGYCTRSCVGDADCGAGAFCGPARAGARVCWLRCPPSGSCPDPRQICNRVLDGAFDLGQRACVPGNAAARDGSPCASFAGCNHDQSCLANPFEAPAGFCVTPGCKPGDSTTCASPAGQCLAIPSVPPSSVCLPGCTGDGDCRQAEGYTCGQLLPGFGPKVCQYRHPGLAGYPCQVDTDCGAGNTPWKCLTSMAEPGDLPGGYCSGVGCDPRRPNSCPYNSHCLVLAGAGKTNFCTADCLKDADCDSLRAGKKGYTCQGIDPGQPSLKGCLPRP